MKCVLTLTDQTVINGVSRWVLLNVKLYWAAIILAIKTFVF
jgi:hypothetical protein